MGLVPLSFLFYFIWICVSFILLHSGIITSMGKTAEVSLTFVMIAGYLILGSSLSYLVIKCVTLRKQSELSLYTAIAFSFLCWGAIFWLVTTRGDYHDIAAILGSANLLYFAAIFGSVLSLAVKRVGELIPLCITASIADISSVLFGPTREIAESLTSYYQQGLVGTPPIADFVVVKFAIPGYSIPLPLFGVTDWIVIALLTSSVLRLGKNDNLLLSSSMLGSYVYLPMSLCGLAFSITLAHFIGIFLPALPLIALFFILYISVKYRALFRLHRSDMVMSVVFPLIISFSIFYAYR